MIKHHETYFCDRCGTKMTEHKSDLPEGISSVQITAHAEGQFSNHFYHKWDVVCRPCWKAIEEFFK